MGSFTPLPLLLVLACTPPPGDASGSPEDSQAPPPQPDLDLVVEGFGAEATGGEGGTEVTVSSLDDSGPGSLREAVEGAKGPTWVRFEVEGAIALESPLDLPSDITLDARGRQLTLRDNGLRLDGVGNVLIANIAFQDVAGETGDAIQILGGAHDIAILHCSFDSSGLQPFVEDVPDEHISVVWGSTDITVAWSRFTVHDKVLLFGNGDAPAETDAAIAVTLHHNWFEQTGRRHPFLRHGRVDMANNVIKDWTRYLEYAYGIRSQEDAQVLAERNWFLQTDETYALASWTTKGGRLKLVDNRTSEDWIILDEADPDAVFERPYDLRIDELDEAWLAMMEQYTGPTMPAP
jgi:pectate lyase